jgi:hypothetical protein
MRATGPHEIDGKEQIITLGCSYTQGWAISDHETYAWNLRARFPSVEILNYGTGGYSTYTTVLVLEKLFQSSQRIKLAIYGFLAFHEDRNVDTGKWLELLSLYSRRNHLFVPYCTLDGEENLTRNPPTSYPVWPLREVFVSVNDLQKIYTRMATIDRYARKGESQKNYC